MLTVREIEAAKPAGKIYRLWDGGGLYLLCPPGGSRLWRFKYRLKGKEGLLAIGRYPEVTLAQARARRDEARVKLRAGHKPPPARQSGQPSTGETIEAIARAWHALNRPRWSERHAQHTLARFERHVFPQLGAKPVSDVTPPLMLACIRKIEARGHGATAHVVRHQMEAVFAYAKGTGIENTNPAAHIADVLAPVVRDNRPALLGIKDVRAMLAKIEAAPGYVPTKLAMRLLALTACRPSEVIGARWQEIEGLGGHAPLWHLPARRMKLKREHVVPLSPQAVAVLKVLRKLTGHGEFLFPNTRSADRPMVRNAFLDVLYRCGYKGKHCAHGFRSSFSTIMNARHPGDWAAIEAALAHVVGGARGAYMRSTYLERRVILMAEWADLLLEGVPPPETLLYGPRR
jgi:integrase